MPHQIGLGHSNCQFYDLVFLLLSNFSHQLSIFWPSGQKNRGDWIRTSDLLVPNQALYQAEPHPVSLKV